MWKRFDMDFDCDTSECGWLQPPEFNLPPPPMPPFLKDMTTKCSEGSSTDFEMCSLIPVSNQSELPRKSLLAAFCLLPSRLVESLHKKCSLFACLSSQIAENHFASTRAEHFASKESPRRRSRRHNITFMLIHFYVEEKKEKAYEDVYFLLFLLA